MKGFFITGTDTAVGKTIIGTAIAIALKNKGVNIIIFKPIETGCDSYPNDVLFYKKFLNLSENLDKLCPFQLKFALAPAVACRLENRSFMLKNIIESYKNLVKNYDMIIIEGAGGLLVPIKEGFMMVDLMCIFQLPVILISANRLGMINHTFLSIDCLNNYGLNLKGVIINHLKYNDNLLSKTNFKILKELKKDVLISKSPYLKNINFINLKKIGEKILLNLKI